MRPPADLFDRVQGLVGSRPVEATYRSGGYSIAGRWTLDLADGRRVFCKLATTDDIAGRLRDEHRNMSALPVELRCEILAFEDGDRPLLVVEDLSHGRWPPPWDQVAIDRALETLERVARTPPPDHVPACETYRDAFTGWQTVATDPGPFLGLSLCSRGWLDRNLPTLLEAERDLELGGDELVHLDFRSDNLCLLDDRVVLVDWNFASRGPRQLDRAYWAPSLRLEGGPLPEEVAPGCGNEAAAISGMFAAHAGLPAPEGAPTVRRFQLRQLRISLPWTCRALDLEPPDVMWARIAIAQHEADLEAGAISEEEWYERVEEDLIDAYLSSDDPRAQSGKGGDEEDWRWARELVLDAIDHDGSFLDIGCANGYLMESVHRWGAERGLRIEPYGLDISWRIASLARLRLPQWSDRIFVGNARDWTPPRHFDLVQIGLDEVPMPQRRAYVERVRSEFLARGGRLVVRPDRDRPGEPTIPEQLARLGFPPDGVIEAGHPRTGAVRRTAYLEAPRTRGPHA